MVWKDAQIKIEDNKIITCLNNIYEIHATREPTLDNINEALAQGYNGANVAWKSLVDHELLHVIIPRKLFGCESYVLRNESTTNQVSTRYALRMYEEAVIISFQYWINTNNKDNVLNLFSEKQLEEVKNDLNNWKRELNLNI